MFANKILSCVSGVATALVLSVAPVSAQPENFSSEITPSSVLAVMQRVGDWQLANPATNRPIGWIQAVGDAGMMALAGIARRREIPRRDVCQGRDKRLAA